MGAVFEFPATNRQADTDSARWDAVRRRDPSADGKFFTCVQTTGIYCRPSCPARPLRRNVVFARTRREAEARGFRPCKRCRPDRLLVGSLSGRISSLDWTRVGGELDARGWARLGRLLSDDACGGLISHFDEESPYRSRIEMARFGFGAGEYKYFADPLPKTVGELRAELYRRLAPVANRWAEEALSGENKPYPPLHADYRRRCAAAGQNKPTPLILHYGVGDYNRLHQDLYGSEIFPIQVAILLSAPAKDFEGGEFVLTEQAPRRQSRASVVPLEKGDAIAFAVNERPAQGRKGPYRVKMRHGVSEIRSGSRYCLGVIFHDTA